WRARVDLQRANEQAGTLHNMITAHFLSVAKPATELEIKRWEEGAAGSYTEVPRIGTHNVFFVDKDVIIPPMYGANSMAIIIAPGVRVLGLDQWSHNSVYFMDGFRLYGR
ncbi:MAG: TIR domain-containing protein, partial [Candidatus Angelobacter sp.]